MDGTGTATYANGDVYEGEFAAGKRQGEGVLRYAAGEVAEGVWENGILKTPAAPVAADGEEAAPAEN